ncbi:MAG: hypothetical protein Q7O66_04740 [Dehalococcoidia bacterium]|nr:hypothetical protein [Dehalococcoidia bacterium]
MHLTLFNIVFREQGERETRVIITSGHAGLPDDEYALLEAYCPDPECDCRRVMLNVVSRREGSRYLASVGFGFDRNDAMAGPYLDPLNPQSQYADTLLPLLVLALADPTYVARLETHYQQFKRGAADQKDPAHEAIRQIWLDEKRWEASQNRKAPGVRKTTTGDRKKKRRKK